MASALKQLRKLQKLQEESQMMIAKVKTIEEQIGGKDHLIAKLSIENDAFRNEA